MWQNYLKLYLNKLYENESNLKKFRLFKTDYQRVSFCLNEIKYPLENDFNILCDFYEIKNKSKHKNKSISDDYRQIGNSFYKKKQFKSSFDNFLLALKHAEPNTKEYFLAYSNRSALFYELNRYEECLNDLNQIKLLNMSKYPEFLEEKLTNREENCRIFLKNQNCLEEIYENNLLNEPHKKYVHMSNKLDVKYTRENGRFCVINKSSCPSDIETGEILFHEKPYCSILLPEYQSFYCENCYKELICDKNNFKYLNIEFCDDCVNVVYCSTACKLESNKYHKYECSILSLLHDLGIAHLAYRIISKTSFEMLSAIYKERVEESRPLEAYYNSQELYKSSDYETIFNLVTNSSQTHLEDLFQYTITSILLSKLYSLNEKKEDISLIATLLTRHIQQTICNAHAITKLRNIPIDDSSSSTYSYEQVRYATAIYPTVSLMNHSCSPNVICSFQVDSNEIIIKSSKKISVTDEDTQIWNCYGPHYLKMNYQERKDVLSEQYHFTCECKFCSVESDSFKLDENNFRKFGFKCLNCKKLLRDCDRCSSKVNLNDYTLKLNKIKYLLARDDWKNLNECLSHFEVIFMNVDEYRVGKDNIQNPVYMINYCKLLDRLARISCESMNFELAITHLGKSIHLLKCIYNEEFNVEIAIEIFKLSEILCNCGKFEIALSRVNEAIEINDKILNKNSQLSEQLNALKKSIIEHVKNKV